MSQRYSEELETGNRKKLLPLQRVAEEEAELCNRLSTTAKRACLNFASCIIYRTLSLCKILKSIVCSGRTFFRIITLITFILVIVVTAGVSHDPEPRLVVLSCPKGWVGYQRKCYYFSEAEGNWDYSQSQCSALGASLAGIDSLQELTFLMRHKGLNSHWIGLRKEEGGQPWKCVNGTEFNNLFPVTGGADCAYLNDVGVSSSKCLTAKNWICSKPGLYLRKG